MHIRKANGLDFPQVLTIANLIGNSPAFNWSELTLGQELNISRTLLAEEGLEILAFLSYRENPDSLEIMALGTRPKALRKGLQLRLMAELQKFATQEKLPIFLEVHAENQAAITLYQRSLFVELSRRRHYYSDGADALVFKWPSDIFHFGF